MTMVEELHRSPSRRLVTSQLRYLTSTTSRGQGQIRQGMSGGRLSAKQRADGQQRHGRPAPGRQYTCFAKDKSNQP
jgi:hypothetical protein